MSTMQMPAREPTENTVLPTNARNQTRWNLPAILIRAYGAGLLYVACAITVFLGALTPMFTQGTSYEFTVVYLLWGGTVGIASVASLLTWLPRADKVRRPCVWMPYVGIIALVILWVIADNMTGGQLF